MIRFFDSHCHLEEGMIHDIELSDTKRVCNIGCDIQSSIDSVSWTKAFPWVYGTVGIHPEFATQLDKLDDIEKLVLQNDKIVAIGEIGLDYHWDDNPSKEIQRECFAEQIKLAKKIDMPIAIHTRDADRETMDLLKDLNAFDNIPVLMHCYSGSAELAKEYIKLGAWISVAGPLTYKNNKKTPQVVLETDLSRLLVETDSPYLSPEPLRGKSNSPVNVKYTAAKIAEIKGISLEQVAEATFINACRFYRIKDN